MRILIFMILLFSLDIYSIYFFSSIIGNLASFLIIFIFMLFGIYIIRNFNRFTFYDIYLKHKLFNFNSVTLLNLISKFYILISAILFIIPGYLSDLLGIFILIIYFISYIKQIIFNFSGNGSKHYNDSFIEGKFKEYKK